MVGIGRRMGNKRVQALITNMDQPLGYAIGNALEVMEVSQTLQNIGPDDLHEISIELAARMIHLGRKAESIDQARELAQAKILNGSAYRKLKEVIEHRAEIRRCLDRFELLPNASGAREFSARAPATSARSMRGHRTRIDDDRRRPRPQGRHNRSGGGVHSRSQVGQKIDAGSVLCRIYYTREERLDDAAEMIEDAFRISSILLTSAI